MSFYNKKALADNQEGILWARYGEVLRLVDSDEISINNLTNIFS